MVQHDNPRFKRLAGKVAIVTGAGTGIGEAAARAFAREGASIVLVGRTEAPLAATADVIRAAGGEAMVVAGNVSDSDDVNAVVARTIDHCEQLDHVFNNAGIQGSSGPIVDMAETDFDELIAINQGPTGRGGPEGHRHVSTRADRKPDSGNTQRRPRKTAAIPDHRCPGALAVSTL